MVPKFLYRSALLRGLFAKENLEVGPSDPSPYLTSVRVEKKTLLTEPRKQLSVFPINESLIFKLSSFICPNKVACKLQGKQICTNERR